MKPSMDNMEITNKNFSAMLNAKEIIVINDRVSVIPRFGETGIVTEIVLDSPNPYGVCFKNLECPLFYKLSEIQKLPNDKKGFSWFRMPPSNI